MLMETHLLRATEISLLAQNLTVPVAELKHCQTLTKLISELSHGRTTLSAELNIFFQVSKLFPRLT